MGYFDRITEVAFKKGENGKTIYFPNGVLGKGRVIEDPILKEKVFKFHKRLHKYLVPFAVFYGILMGFGGGASLNAISPLIIIAAFVFLRQRFLIKDLPKHNVKLTVKEASTSTSKAMHPAVLVFMMLNGAMCIVLSLLLPSLFGKPINEIQSLVLIIFMLGVVLLAISIYLYKVKKSNKRV